MKPATRLAAVGTTLFAAACTGVATSYYVDNDTSYYPEFVQYASANGEMATEIRGNPFGAPGRGDSEAIAAALSLPGWFAPVRFTTRPSDRGRAIHRVVMIFNPVNPAPGGRVACRDPDAVAVAPGSSEMRVQLALCSGDSRMSEAIVVGPAGGGPTDPAFQATINAGLMELMPPQDYRDLDDPCALPC